MSERKLRLTKGGTLVWVDLSGNQKDVSPSESEEVQKIFRESGQPIQVGQANGLPITRPGETPAGVHLAPGFERGPDGFPRPIAPDPRPPIYCEENREYWDLERRRMIAQLRNLDKWYGWQTFGKKGKRRR